MGKPSSDNIYKPTGSSDITTPEKSCKMLTHTPRLRYYHPTRLPQTLTQPYSSASNIGESSYTNSVKGMYTMEKISEYLHLPPEVGINQVSESDKVRNSISW